MAEITGFEKTYRISKEEIESRGFEKGYKDSKGKWYTAAEGREIIEGHTQGRRASIEGIYGESPWLGGRVSRNRSLVFESASKTIHRA